ncbi:glycosyltransferase family 28 [Vagococcus lutrae]|uniref:glycosyltransferase n=1 Tax=Vagococcus lutrae TaxID=81947 RepID=UPI001925C5C5|nr:glycosyltransferase [Vagococcus lutrae]GEQ62379.1 glycosyltransferase family 28 [Vagococcus lutrae]GEQ64285.1 glycosyltransferase family 28 [Vagococcus lutrae]GEQ66176.1 glycosyltransferase family 28 [Vagococcus lutrae]
MIFVTVGTHEQKFDRLINEIFSLINKKIIKENVFIQYGYSSPIENNDLVHGEKLLSQKKLTQYSLDCNIPITHGGPASFMFFLKENKVPIVVPRQEKYEEHINNHQLDFCKKIEKEGFPIIVIEDIKKLEDAIINYEKLSYEYLNDNNSKFGNTKAFNQKLYKEINKMIEGL